MILTEKQTEKSDFYPSPTVNLPAPADYFDNGYDEIHCQ